VNVSIGADDHRVLERGVLPYLARATQKLQPILLVTQMSGSHPPFAAQVPQELKPFLPEPSPNSVNAYDNTVWYTDLYLHRLVQAVRDQRPGAWVFLHPITGSMWETEKPVFMGIWVTPLPTCHCWCFHLRQP
jgi:glucan phosphoethanolaminetransferase (alkaline phosphatase superfamily)